MYYCRPSLRRFLDINIGSGAKDLFQRRNPEHLPGVDSFSSVPT
jgi:hypothetical protein